jgi:hypothetical protein
MFQNTDRLGSRRAGACLEAELVIKMTTMLEDVLPKSSVQLCISCGQKDSMQKIFIKKCFLFTLESVCRVKRFTTGWQMFATFLDQIVTALHDKHFPP